MSSVSATAGAGHVAATPGIFVQDNSPNRHPKESVYREKHDGQAQR
jgi:hypothetical protein